VEHSRTYKLPFILLCFPFFKKAVIKIMVDYNTNKAPHCANGIPDGRNLDLQPQQFCICFISANATPLFGDFTVGKSPFEQLVRERYER
jgi:hypothetical protein